MLGVTLPACAALVVRRPMILVRSKKIDFAIDCQGVANCLRVAMCGVTILCQHWRKGAPESRGAAAPLRCCSLFNAFGKPRVEDDSFSKSWLP